MASDGSSSGEKSVVMKKVHHLNPRRRNKVKGKLPEKDLTEEEKRRRNEQKKRRELAMKLRAEGKTYSSETFNRKKRKAAFKGEGGQGGRPKKKIKVKSSQRNKAPYNVIILPIAWHQRKEESARILAAAETAEQLLAAAGITSRIDDTDNYTPGQKMKYWELRGVRVRLEIGPKESLSGTAVLALAAGAPGEVAAKSSVKIKEPGLSERVKAALLQLGEKLGQQQQQQGEEGKEGKVEGPGGEQQQGQEGQKQKKRPAAAAAAAEVLGEAEEQQQHKKKKQRKQRDGEDAAAAAGGEGAGKKSKEEREQQRAAAKAKLKQQLSALVAEEVSHDDDGGDDSADGQPGSKQQQQQQQQQQQPVKAAKQPQQPRQPPAAAAAAAVFESADALEDDFEFLAEGGEDGEDGEGPTAAAAAAAAGRPGKKFQNKQRGRKPAAAAAAAGGSGDVQLGLSAGWPDGGGAKKQKKGSKVVKF